MNEPPTLDKFGMCQECKLTSLDDIHIEAGKVNFFHTMKKQFDITIGKNTSA